MDEEKRDDMVKFLFEIGWMDPFATKNELKE